MNKSATEQRLYEAIQKVAVGPDRGRDLDRQHAQALMEGVLAGEGDELQVAVLLIALRMKRESVEEYIGLYNALQQATPVIDLDLPQLCMLGDPYNGYLRCLPMSPFVPAVLATCGLPCLITGVESVGPKFGVTAHQVYRAAGIDPLLSASRVAGQLTTHGWGYLDQSISSPALFGLTELRRRMVKRTALTTLERLLMPLRARNHNQLLLGYVHRAYPQIYSALAEHAGFSDLLLVKGVEGGIGPALNKPLRAEHHGILTETISQLRFDLPTQLAAERAAPELPEDIPASASACLALGLAALAGEPGVARNSLVVMSALPLAQFGDANSYSQAVEKVEHCLDNGEALVSFNSLLTA